MSSRSNATAAMIRSSASISTMLERLRCGTPRAAWSRPETRLREGEAVAAGRDNGRLEVLDARGRRPLASSRFWHPDRVGSQRSPPGDDRHGEVVGHRASAMRVPVAGREHASGSARHTWLAAFSSRGAAVLSSSNLASAASMSASSKSSQRLIRSPSTVRTGSSRHSASKPSCEVPCAAWVTTAAEVAQPMHGLDVDARSGVRSHAARTYAFRSPGANAVTAPVVDVHPVGVVAGVRAG